MVDLDQKESCLQQRKKVLIV